jgi:hypothetical protein
LCTALAAVAVTIDDARAGSLHVSDSASFQAALNSASTGDEILLAPGVYPGRFTAVGIQNVAIRSADPADQAVIDAAGLGEGLKLSSVKNVAITDLTIRNASLNGINIDDGGFIDPSESITVARVTLRDGGGDGIKLAGVEGFHVDQVKVIGWGGEWTAVNMVGSHGGLVERSYFENLQPGSGTGVQAKAGAADIVIRANRFVNANERSIQIGGGGALDVFRPQPPGEVHAANVVAEGNVILNNGNVGQGIRSAASFINVKDGVFRNNVAYRPSVFLLRFLKENFESNFVDTQGGVVADNIFLWNEGDLFQAANVGPGTLPETFTFSGNDWYNITYPNFSQLGLPVVETGGTYGVNPQFDMRGITPWDQSWGKWLVNTSDQVDAVALDAGVNYLLATPGEGATLDIGATNPLRGAWSLSPAAPGDFTVEPFDYAVLLKTAAPTTPGDYNGDGVVDELDVAIWSYTYGSSDVLAADGSSDGAVDGEDFLVWQRALGSTAIGANAAVPEPTGLALFILAVGRFARRH